MANLFQCQYIKACIFKIYKDFHSTDTTGKYESFSDQFGIDINKKDFIKYSKRFIEHSRKSGNNVNKANLLNTFSFEEWEKLDGSTKNMHSLRDCAGCLQNNVDLTTPVSPINSQSTTPTAITAFPLLSNSSTAFTLPIPSISTPSSSAVVPSSDIASSSAKSIKISFELPIPDTPLIFSATKKIAANIVVDEVEKNYWQKVFPGSQFATDGLCKVKGITKIISPAEKKKKLRNLHKKAKAAIEKSMAEVDCETLYGIRQSGAMFEKQRFALSYEKKSNAFARTKRSKIIVMLILNNFDISVLADFHLRFSFLYKGNSFVYK